MSNRTNLQELYIEKNTSQREIAKLLNLTRSRIRTMLKHQNIKKDENQSFELMSKTFFKKGSKINLERIRQDMQGEKNPMNRLGLKYIFVGENHSMWVGDEVGYMALHSWIARKYGDANHCENPSCSYNSNKFNWANISGHYKRDVNDFIQLCVSCHRNFDLDKIKLVELGVVQ